VIRGALRGLDLVETRVAEPHRRLMAAVLKAVVDDYREYAGRRSGGWDGPPAMPRLVEDVRAYVASADRGWPFSFENLCDALGIDPDFLRQTLRREDDEHRTIQTTQSV